MPRPLLPLAQRRSPLAALLLALGLTTTAAASPPASSPSCGCTYGERLYTLAPTDDVLALWEAASAGREEEFMRRLPKVERLADQAVKGRPLLAALLSPPESLRSTRRYSTMEPEEIAMLVSAHRQLLPARTRMLAAALQRGASVSDVTSQAPYPPLHLAMAFGSPEMVELLLGAGAPLEGRDSSSQDTALEFLLRQDSFVEWTYLPPLVSRAQRGEMLVQLLKAGAQRPYMKWDEQKAEQGRFHQPAADYLAWKPLLMLTEGAAPVLALLATGTRPDYQLENRDGPTPLALAAATGNAGAVEVLKPLAPKSLMYMGGMAAGQLSWSLQLDAALAAAATGHLALAKSLVEPGMPMGQRGPWRVADYLAKFSHLDKVKEGTLLHFAVRAGDIDWVRELLARGAPPDGSPDEPGPSALAEAEAAKRTAMAELLLQHGANPLRGDSSAPPALLSAIQAGEVERVRGMLSRIDKPERRGELAALSSRIASAWARSAAFTTPQQWPLLKQWLDAAGFDPRQIRAGVLSEVIGAGEPDWARSLIAAGAPVEPSPEDGSGEAPLTAAILKGDSSLVALLVARGASVERRDDRHGLPIQLAILQGKIAVVEELLRARASLEFPAAPHGSAFDLAVASGRMELVDLVAKVSGRRLGDACIDLPAAADTLLHDEQFFDALLAQGLKTRAACNAQPGLLARLYESMIHRHPRPWLGRQRESLTRLFAKIDGGAGARLRIGENGRQTPLEAAMRAHRPDVVGILLDSGASALASGSAGSAPAWLAVSLRQPGMLRPLLAHGASLADPGPDGWSLGDHVRCRESESFRRAAALALPENQACPKAPPMNPREKALARRLVGQYELSGSSEASSDILLQANGEFTYSYKPILGKVHETAQGRWQVRGKNIILSAPGEAGTPMRLRDSSRDASGGGSAVRFRVQGQTLPGLTVLLSGGDRQRELEYRPNETGGFLRVPEVADAETLAWRHPRIADGRWQVVDLPAGPAGERFNRFDFELDEKSIAPGLEFRQVVAIQGRALLMKRSGHSLRYERE